MEPSGKNISTDQIVVEVVDVVADEVGLVVARARGGRDGGKLRGDVVEALGLVI